MRLVDGHGRSFGTLLASGNPDQQSLLSEYEIYRGDLSRILYDMTKDDPNVQYIFGEQVTGIEQEVSDQHGSVRVSFANGLDPKTFDLVVACDGAASRTRAIGMGCSPRDYVSSTNCWAAYFKIGEDLLDRSQLEHGYSAPGGRFITMHADESTTRAMLMAVRPSRPDSLPCFRNAQKNGDQATRSFVHGYFNNSGWRTSELLSAMMTADDFYASELVKVEVPKLSNGRFVLVGDAGYAPGLTGGGTSLAMAGAYVLAGEIGKHAGDLQAGLRGYEDTMRPIIKELRQAPPFLTTIMSPQTAWGICGCGEESIIGSWPKILRRGIR